MLSILLAALKIIGIILLCILGLLLFAVCLVLFVPVRYRAKGYFKNKHDKKIYVTASYLLHIVHISFCYTDISDFAIRIFGFRINGRKKKDKVVQTVNETEEKKVSNTSDEVYIVDEVNTVEKTKTVSEAIADNSKDSLSLDVQTKEDTSNNKKTGLIDRICGIKDNLDYYLEILQRDSTKRAFSVCKDRIGKLLKAVLPRRGNINILFGLEDYGLTGKILGAYYALLGYIGRVIHLKADFGNKIFEADMNIKGRIYCINALYQLIRLYFNKDCRKLIKTFRNKEKKRD